MYTQNGYDNCQETPKEFRDAIKQYVSEKNRFIEYVSKVEPISIWYSNAPYAMCGFYYICNLLKNASS